MRSLRLLNEALFESQRQLSQSEKLAALGQVTATMAHQIGTPLNSISGYIQLMLQEETFDPKNENASRSSNRNWTDWPIPSKTCSPLPGNPNPN